MQHEGSHHDETDDHADHDAGVKDAGANTSKQTTEQSRIHGWPSVLVLVAHTKTDQSSHRPA